MHSVSVNLEPAQYLAGLAAGDGQPLPAGARRTSRVGDEVARAGRDLRPDDPRHALREGRARAARRAPRAPAGRRAAARPRAASPPPASSPWRRAGEPVSFRERAPRYAVERRLVVEHGGDLFETATVNVSEGGLRRPLARISSRSSARGRGAASAPGSSPRRARAVVCWNQPGGAARAERRAAAVSDGARGRGLGSGLVGETPARRRPRGLTRPRGARGKPARVIRFELLAEDGAARRGRLHTAARRHRDPGLHAGRHGRDGEDAGPARPPRASARGSSSPTPTTCTSARATRWWRGWAACTASCRGTARSSPTPAASRSSASGERGGRGARALRAGARRDLRGGGRVPEPPRRLAPLALARAGDRGPGGARRRRHHGLRRVPAVARRPRLPRAVARAHAALAACAAATPGGELEAGSAATGGRAVRALRHRAGRALPGPARARHRGGGRARPPGLRARRLRGRRGAGADVGGRGARRAAAAAREAALPHGRRHARGPARRRRGRASTCSTACCRPATARNGLLFTSRGKLVIRNARFADDERPGRPGVRLLHLPDVHPRLPAPPLQGRRDPRRCALNTLHNLHFYLSLMRRRARPPSRRGGFEAFPRERRLEAWREAAGRTPAPGERTGPRPERGCGSAPTHARRRRFSLSRDPAETDASRPPRVPVADRPRARRRTRSCSFLPFILIAVVFYFVFFRPQAKQAKKHQTFLTALKKGDEVVTQGGIIGTVVAGRGSHGARRRRRRDEAAGPQEPGRRPVEAGRPQPVKAEAKK